MATALLPQDPGTVVASTRHLPAAILPCFVHAGALPLSDSPLRLAGGPTPRQGRLEVQHLDAWGTVCRDGWDATGETNAQELCTQLVGSSSRGALVMGLFPPGRGIVWLSELNCSDGSGGMGAVAASCTHAPWGWHRACTHAMDVGLMCEPRQGGDDGEGEPSWPCQMGLWGQPIG